MSDAMAALYNSILCVTGPDIRTLDADQIRTLEYNIKYITDRLTEWKAASSKA